MESGPQGKMLEEGWRNEFNGRGGGMGKIVKPSLKFCL